MATAPARRSAKPGCRCSTETPATRCKKSARANTSVAHKVTPKPGSDGVTGHLLCPKVGHYNERSTIKGRSLHNAPRYVNLPFRSPDSDGPELGQGDVIVALELDNNRHANPDVVVVDLDDIGRKARAFLEFDNGHVVGRFGGPAGLVFLMHDAESADRPAAACLLPGVLVRKALVA